MNTPEPTAAIDRDDERLERISRALEYAEAISKHLNEVRDMFAIPYAEKRDNACDSRHSAGECPWCDQQGFDEHVAAQVAAHNAETCADPACPDHGDDPHTMYTGDGSDLG